jgi:hypothetical protein
MPPRAAAKDSDVAAFFADYPPFVEQLALALRDLIFECVPGVSEVLDRSARVVGYGFGTGYKDTVCAIVMSQKGVKLGLSDGASLPDSKGLLAGEGKRHKHIAFSTMADLKRPGVKQLLNACYAAWKKRSDAAPKTKAKPRG